MVTPITAKSPLCARADNKKMAQTFWEPSWNVAVQHVFYRIGGMAVTNVSSGCGCFKPPFLGKSAQLELRTKNNRTSSSSFLLLFWSLSTSRGCGQSSFSVFDLLTRLKGAFSPYLSPPCLHVPHSGFSPNDSGVSFYLFYFRI